MRFERVMVNGMYAYVMPMPFVKSIACGILVRAGTCDETWPRQAGLAHAFEHMVFQGNGRLDSSQEISAEIESIGGVLNAWTWKESTFFHNVVPVGALQISLQSLVSLISTPCFESERIRVEMQNVVEEIKRSEDGPSSACSNALQRLVFSGTPLEKETLGTRESVLALTPEDFRDWHNRYYGPWNCVFIAVGNTTADEVSRCLGALTVGNAEFECGYNVRTSERIAPHIPQRAIIERDVNQVNICVGAPIAGMRDPNARALDMYADMVGGGMSFPLFQEVRDKRGLCYGVHCSVLPGSDMSAFTVSIGTSRERFAEALDCIYAVLDEHADNGALMQRAVKMQLGRHSLAFSSPATVLGNAAMDVTYYGHPRSLDDIESKLRQMRIEAVTMAVRNSIQRGRFDSAFVVPHGTVV